MENLLAIQMLRGLAALLVVCFHTLAFTRPSEGAGSWVSVFEFGTIGVDIFFIVSGFIMFHIRERYFVDDEPRAREFLIKRMFRIVPPYWMYSILVAIVFFLSPTLFSGEPPSFFHSFFLVPHSEPFFVMVGWSLSFEIYFYFLFAATLFCSRNAFVQLSLLFFFFAVSFLAGLIIEPQSAIGDFLVSPMHFLFVIGGVFRLSIVALTKLSPFSVPFIAVGVVGYLFASFEFLPTARNSLDGFLVVVFVSSSIFLGLLLLGEKVPRIVSTTLQVVGDASYSLYLSHWLVINVIALLLIRFETFNSLLFTLLCIALSVLYSLLTWRLVENNVPEFVLRVCKSAFMKKDHVS